jgi:hypothetical protein
MNEIPRHIVDDNGTPEIGSQGSKTQINERDHKHLLAFPAHRKTQVLKHIESHAPMRSVVYQGKSGYERAVFNLHRDGYGLIDMQPQESLFTTLWYRKDRSILSMGADVTMLLWEDGGNDDEDSTTLTNWRI